MEFPGYHLTERVFQSPKTVFYRGIRKADRRPVLVKTLNSPFPSVIDRANYKNEYQITRDLQSASVLRPLSLEMDRNRFGLVLEDFSGRPPNPDTFLDIFGIGGFLRIAIRVSEFLGECHQQQIIHRNLKPHNLLIDAQSLEVRVLGFLLTSIRDEHLSEDRLSQFIGALAFISPEQSGRMNRNVDHRTDFYSLGITFYQLLTRSLPFNADDPLALVHCHLAMAPESPHKRREDIPEAISEILLKMLAKTPEDRYQSGFGLASDWRRCLEQWQARGSVDSFPLGERDVPQELRLPRRLYGREPERRKLLDAFEDVKQGATRLLSVVAQSGMGKSELVNELHKPIAAAHGYFIVGKYDQGKQAPPYKGLGMAFKELLQQVLSETPAEVTRWRERLVEALGPNGQVIVELAPELALIIGKQPPVPSLGVAESQNRFKMTVRNFISVFATKDHPLAIFLDDMQWADQASLELISTLIHDVEIRHLFLIIACREEDVRDQSSLSRWLADLRREGDTPELLELQPLDLLDVQTLVRDVFACEPSAAKRLAEIVLEHTHGKPFDIAVFLHALYDQGLLRFDARRGEWLWDPEAVRQAGESRRDVADLVADRFNRLPEQSRSTLKVAACIGARFNLNLLSVASQRSPSEVAADLGSAIDDGLIEPLGDAYRLLQVYDVGELEASESRVEITFQFSHNRFHQTIYSLMDEDQSIETHLRVGQRLLRNTETLEGDIFNVVNQLNFGRQAIDNSEERMQLARLNLRAGEKARNSIAYHHALEYFVIARELLPEDALDTAYDLWFDVHLNLAEMEFFNHNLKAAEDLLQVILNKARTRKDKARVFLERVLIFNNISRFKDAVRVGVEGLRLYGLNIPEDRDQLKGEVEARLRDVRAWFDEHDLSELTTMPAASDDETREAMALLMILTPPAFNTDQELFKLIALLQIRFSFEHGLTSDSPYAVAVLGILFGNLKEYALGFKLGRLALDLNRMYPDPVIKYKLDFIGCNLLNHWARPLSEDLPILAQVYRESLAFGDLVYANYAGLVDYQHRWVLDHPLLKILNDCEDQILFAKRTKNIAVMESQRYINHAILNLRGLTHASDSLETADFNEAECERNLREASYLTGVSVFHIIRMQILYLRGHYTQAREAGERATELIRFSENTLMMTVHYFFYGLTLAACFEEAEEDERPAMLEVMTDCRDRYEVWARNCPENFRHKYLMLKAELRRVKGEGCNVISDFHDAIDAAAEQNLTMGEALAHELAMRFFEAEGYAPYLEFHLRAAIHCYNRWGASAKVADLENAYGQYLNNPVWNKRYGIGMDDQHAYSRALDMTTLMKSAQTISGEFRIEQLLQKLMHLVLENAGAQRGYLIVMREGRLLLEAYGSVSEEGVVLCDGRPLEQVEHIAKSVVHYVTRTRADLVIEDLGEAVQFRNDVYLQNSGVKALLCVPILRQNELVGILYLENHLAAGAFSKARVEMLRLLTPQIAISLENARFVSEMTELNSTLQVEVEERKKAEQSLKKAQRIALANAHKAAKAEFANSVLHNINNVLTSVGLSCEVIVNVAKSSKIKQLGKLVRLINKHKEDLGTFFTEHPKGQITPNYLEQLDQVLVDEQDILKEEVADLSKSLSLMRDIIEKQQADAKGVLKSQTTDLMVLIEDALKIHQDLIQRHGIEVLRQYETEQAVQADGTQVTHILLNLIKNAVEAMGFAERKILTVRIFIDDQDYVCVAIRDTGVGITTSDLKQMFTHGFTTKQSGHGFGLNYCAKAMKEMGGHIEVHSDGRGKGAVFTLRFRPELETTAT